MRKFVVILWVGLTLAGCQTNAIPPTPSPSAVPGATLTSAPIQTATQPPQPAAPTPAPSSTPTAAPTADFIHPRLVTIARGLTEPDDLLVGADGSIFVSDVGDGTIRRIAPDGSIQVILSGLADPEGMVELPDRSLVIAEQGKNRLIHWDPATGVLLPLLTLENPSGGLGVDGIALDERPGQAPSLIIPDSPNNRVLRAGLDGKGVTVIARGLSRPTGAWVEADGSLLVVEENGAALVRLHPDGSLEKVAGRLPTPDDVVEDREGNIFVVTLGDNALHWIAPNGKDRIISKDFSSPQGLALDADGNLLVADPGNHRVVKLTIHGK